MLSYKLTNPYIKSSCRGYSGNNKLANNDLSFQGFNASRIKDGFQKNMVMGAVACVGIGQMQSDLIKAAGKSTLTPLVIMFNKFASKDKESRKTAALIQPVEAGVGFLASFGVNSAANVAIDRLAKKGRLGDFYNITGKSGKALEVTKERLGIFKDRSFFLVTLLTIPFTSAFLNWIFPKILNKLSPKQPESKVNR